MLFNSVGFLLVFLPVTVLGFFLLARRSQFMAASWMGFASIIFYGWWNYRYIPLLLGSIMFNYWSSWKIGGSEQPQKKRWLVLAIATNLVLLGYYKYAGFLVASVVSFTGLPLAVLNVILPIGISFFTFTQIAFLVDTYQGKVNERRFVHYLLFVTYFPHLIAGPVLHHKEMMPQFADPRNYQPRAANFAIGNAIFFIGLAKKVLIADNLAPYAAQLFGQTGSPSLLAAWGGVLAYAFQIYFDFSGYSDMAIGLSRLFGVQLPMNFNSPYKATNISEFWHRWHMTLSRFLRDYLYIPLGGNRKGKVRRYANLMVTMLLGGLWHGAGWNFVIWGGLHGIYLVIHQTWIALTGGLGGKGNSAMMRFVSTLMTFVAVCFAWAFFRAPNLAISVDVISGMAGLHGLGSLQLTPGDLGAVGSQLEVWMAVLVSGGIAFLLPNTQEIVGRYLADANDGAIAVDSSGAVLYKTPHPMLPVALGVISAVALMNISRPSEFLYFNF